MSSTIPSNASYQWCENRNDPPHSKKIYLSLPDPLLPRWVVKIETSKERDLKRILDLPHAEEISYKVSKLLKWDTVPKTKILHQNSNKIVAKYKNLMNDFISSECPKTFTFQSFVEGDPIRNSDRKKTLNPDPCSYQKAYLLGMILSKFNARDNSILFNSETRKLFEISYEYFGSEGYEKSGVLNRFADLKNTEIAPSVLEDVLKVTDEDLAQIQSKYTDKDLVLIDLWLKERANTIEKSTSISINKTNLTEYYDSEMECKSIGNNNDSDDMIKECWSKILKNFEFLKKEILHLKEQGDPITIAKLEKGIHLAYEALHRPDSLLAGGAFHFEL